MGLAAQYDAQTVNIPEVLLLKDLEGQSGWRAWVAWHTRIVPTFRRNYSISVYIVK